MTSYLRPKRLSFMIDETVHSWLPMLVDAYYIVDKGIADVIKMEEEKGQRVACNKGCSNCCKTHKDIPVYPLELVGISWYVTEKVGGPKREIIKKQLKNHKEGDPCPFLAGGSCLVHPMRPISCRQFVVFNRMCNEDEDPYYTRREDVLSPIKEYVDQAFFIMLPFYGMKDEYERMDAIEKGAMHKMVTLIQTCNWNKLADKMWDFDKKIKKKG